MDAAQHNGDVAEASEKLEKSLSMDTDGGDKMAAYHRFIRDGKDVARQGDMHKALNFFKLQILGLGLHQLLGLLDPPFDVVVRLLVLRVLLMVDVDGKHEVVVGDPKHLHGVEVGDVLVQLRV